MVEVVREAYPDPTAKDGATGEAKGGDWVAVDVKAVGPLKRPVALATIKNDPAFADFLLVRQGRLSARAMHGLQP